MVLRKYSQYLGSSGLQSVRRQLAVGSCAEVLLLHPRAFGPRPPTAARRAPPSTSEGAYGSETEPPSPEPTAAKPTRAGEMGLKQRQGGQTTVRLPASTQQLPTNSRH